MFDKIGMQRSISSIPDIEMRWSEPLARHTTFRVGGPVACLARPRTESALAALMLSVREQEIAHVILGGGSNVLPPDEPWDVLAVQLTLSSSNITLCGEEAGGRVRVYTGAGVRLSRWLRFCLHNGLGGVEGLVGIPGTVGGALVMNAGTKDGCIADTLLWVDLIDSEGRKQKLFKSDLPAGYRSIGLPENCMITGACFELTPVSSLSLRKCLGERMRRRKGTQPLAWPSAGCVYKNPPGMSAGALIDKANLKGFRIGDAEVSPMHANWIINRGSARRGDILTLMQHIEEEVFRSFGICLEREIRLLKP